MNQASELTAVWSKLDSHTEKLAAHDNQLGVHEHRIVDLKKESHEIVIEAQKTESRIIAGQEETNKQLKELLKAHYESVGESRGKKSSSDFMKQALQAAVWVIAILAYFGISGK